jgi:hypothetical protein
MFCILLVSSNEARVIADVYVVRYTLQCGCDGHRYESNVCDDRNWFFSRERLKNSLIVWVLCFLKNVWISSIGIYLEGGVWVRLRFDKCLTDEENTHTITLGLFIFVFPSVTCKKDLMKTWLAQLITCRPCRQSLKQIITDFFVLLL